MQLMEELFFHFGLNVIMDRPDPYNMCLKPVAPAAVGSNPSGVLSKPSF